MRREHVGYLEKTHIDAIRNQGYSKHIEVQNLQIIHMLHLNTLKPRQENFWI